MHLRRISCAIVALAAVAGCSRQETIQCDPEARYSTARSAPPVQIPDDLSPPDESDAIRLPSDVGPVSSITAGECLEAPPPFFGDSRPFVVDADSEESDEPRRRSRREARRQARVETPAAPAAEPESAPTEQVDPPPGDDRVIDN
jgi:uncharacterized lipoprotein